MAKEVIVSTGRGYTKCSPEPSYLNGNKIIDEIVDRIDVTKKVRTPKELIHRHVVEVFAAMRYFNTLSENTEYVDGHLLSTIPIMEEFKGFIWPNVIRYDANNRRMADLTVRAKFADEFKMIKENDNEVEKQLNPYRFNFNNYLDSIAYLRSIYKKSHNENIIMLDSLRINKNFEDVRPVMVDADSSFAAFGFVNDVYYDSTPFIPIPVAGVNSLLGERYFNASYIDAVRDWIADFSL